MTGWTLLLCAVVAHPSYPRLFVEGRERPMLEKAYAPLHEKPRIAGMRNDGAQQ